MKIASNESARRSPRSTFCIHSDQFIWPAFKGPPKDIGPLGRSMEFPGIRDSQIFGFMRLFGYPIAGYGNVCMADDSNNAFSMKFTQSDRLFKGFRKSGFPETRFPEVRICGNPDIRISGCHRISGYPDVDELARK